MRGTAKALSCHEGQRHRDAERSQVKLRHRVVKRSNGKEKRSIAMAMNIAASRGGGKAEQR